MTISEEDRAQIKAKHKGELRLVTAGDYSLVFCTPSRHEWDAWIDADKSQAGLRVMAKNCCVYPEDADAAINELLDKYPAVLGNGIADALLELAGVELATVS